MASIELVARDTGIEPIKLGFRMPAPRLVESRSWRKATAGRTNVNGAGRRNRTPDFRFTRAALCLLSYASQRDKWRLTRSASRRRRIHVSRPSSGRFTMSDSPTRPFPGGCQADKGWGFGSLRGPCSSLPCRQRADPLPFILYRSPVRGYSTRQNTTCAAGNPVAASVSSLWCRALTCCLYRILYY